MKLTFKIILLTLLALVCCALLASCGASDDAEITALSFGYLTESDYNDGSFSENAIAKQVDPVMETAYYMVIDFRIKANTNNKGKNSVKIETLVSDGLALTVAVQDAPTGNFGTEQNDDGSRSYRLFYSVPTDKQEEKSVRTILKLIPAGGGETNVTVSVSGGNGSTVVGQASESTTFYPKTLNLAFAMQDDGTYAVSGMGDCTGEKIIIPSVYRGASVTAIGANAFRNHDEITSISIPDSIKSIGAEAFKGCTGLESFLVPGGVTSIGFSAFYSCTNLTSMTLPFVGSSADGTENTHFGYIFGASTYDTQQFYIPPFLKTVTVDGAVTSIGNFAFSDCTGLMDIVISGSVKSIGASAFSGCSGLTDITVSEGVQSIGDSAFSGCVGLTGIAIPDSVTNVRAAVFVDCVNLKQISVNASNAYYYSENGVLFNKATKELICYPQGKTETSYSIPSGVTSIGDRAFYGCNRLVVITVPGGVTSIDSHAFYGCGSLTSIVIPDDVTSIGFSAFGNCGSLNVITYTGITAQWKAITFASGWNLNTGNYSVICTDGTLPKSGS